MMPPAADPLYFLHIPKTAGTSFMAALHEQFAPHEVCPAYMWRDLLAIPRASLDGYQLYRGHFYSYLDRYLRRELRCLTMLREPLERSISHFEHVLREPPHYFHARAQNGIVPFLQDPEARTLVENFQTRALAQDLDPVAIAGGMDAHQIEQLELERRLETTMPTGISDDELLRRAKARLDSCVFVGVVERFDDSLALLSHTLGWRAPSSGKRLNVRQNRTRANELPAEALQMIADLTRLDAELYRYALELFERRCWDMECDLASERIIEGRWAARHLPQSGTILTIGGCADLMMALGHCPDVRLHCMANGSHYAHVSGVTHYPDELIGNQLPAGSFDAVVMLSALGRQSKLSNHRAPVYNIDRLVLAECWRLLRPGANLILTVPAGPDRLTSWHRQYSPEALHELLQGWRAEIRYWGYQEGNYTPIHETHVKQYDYRAYHGRGAGAGAIAGVVAGRM